LVPVSWQKSLRNGRVKKYDPAAMHNEVCKSLYGINKHITQLLEIWHCPGLEARA